MADRTRVGVVGCGLIAQVMHLPYLVELSDRFEIAAVCDLREDVARACADRYGVPGVFTRWEDLLEDPLDAVLIATSGDHAPIAIAGRSASACTCSSRSRWRSRAPTANGWPTPRGAPAFA